MYELTFLINPNISEEETANLIKQVQDFVIRYEGQVIKGPSSQKINLAYPIKKLRQATLVNFEFDLEKDKVETFRNHIKDFKEILRHLLITKYPIKIVPKRIKPLKPKAETKPKTKVKIEELDKKLEELLEE